MTLQVLTTQPNWTTPVLERLEWRTDVLKSRNGSEQRIKIRENPRHMLEYDFLVGNDEYRDLQVKLLRWQSEKWVVPLWMHVQKITNPLGVGYTRIFMAATLTYEYQVGSHLFLFLAYNKCEYLLVHEIGANYIDVSSPTTYAWPKGTQVMPARYGRLASSIPLKAITSDIVSGTLQVNIENTSALGYTVSDQIEGITYFGAEPNRAGTLDMEWSRNLGILDYNTGPILSYDLQGRTEVIRHFDYLSVNRIGQNKIRALVNFCKGRWTSFLLPTFQSDMKIVGTDYLATDNSFNIKNIRYYQDYFAQISHPFLRIELRTGPVLVRKVQSVLDNANGLEQITLSTPFGVAFKAVDVKRISIINMSRLDTDAVEFSWITPNVSSTAIITRSIPE